jgi:tetratricopeptide (TPR) repeat protein
MDDLDDLPGRNRNHVIDDAADLAFREAITVSHAFIIQGSARRDYGVDYWLEVVGEDVATNITVHVQLKGTEDDLNDDGSVSVSVRRVNLNYLLMHPNSIYVCYHLPSASLRVRPAESVHAQYAHGGADWSAQKSITVKFTEALTEARLKSLADLARERAVASRNKRAAQVRAPATEVAKVVRRALPDLHVPEDPKAAAELLDGLYQDDAEALISDAADRFRAVLGDDHDAMSFCHMAEVNLAMAGKGRDRARISQAIEFFRSRLTTGRFELGSLYYSIGNAFSALGEERAAVEAYETALQHLDLGLAREHVAQCHKNLGSSFERLGDQDTALAHYRLALELSPHLNEALHAVASHHHRVGEYEAALEHFDRIAFPDNRLGKQLSVSGWRANILFNLGDAKGAFREINRLVSDARNEDWIWPWCARQVANFGRMSPESGKLAVAFWERFLAAHPDSADGVRESLMCALFLRSHDSLGQTYEAFQERFENGIGHVRGEEAAYLWDRLGHWAQDEDNWTQAERCYRMAYDLDGGHYGYCLGTALNFLRRYEESLPLLLAQAEELQPDDQSWFQVAVAYEHLGNTVASVSAYERAIALNPNYDLAWFNLGGVHWNSRDWIKARATWKTAVDRFPDHALAATIRQDFGFVVF